jgi:hypothetical protein
MASFLHRHRAQPRSPVPEQLWTSRPTRMVRRAGISALRRHRSLVQQASAAALRGKSGLSPSGRCYPVSQSAARDATAPSRSVCRGGGRAQASSACNARGLLAATCSCESTACLESEAVLPNPSLKLTRYGMQRKPGVRRLRHLRTPGLHCTPPRAA